MRSPDLYATASRWRGSLLRGVSNSDGSVGLGRESVNGGRQARRFRFLVRPRVQLVVRVTYGFFRYSSVCKQNSRAELP